MDVPKYAEFFNPVLQALRELGGSASNAELTEAVVRIMRLPPAVTEVTYANGRVTLVEYRLSWARSHLKKVGLVENSERGIWSLTVEGKRTPVVDPRLVQRQARSAPTGAGDVAEPFDGLPPADGEGMPAADWRAQALDALRAMSPGGFERLCQRLLRESGFFQVEVTGKSGDGGIDGHGIVRIHGLLSFPVIFQAKRYAGSVGSAEVRNFRGAMVGRADKALLITTGSFTASAREEAIRDGAPPIDLVDGTALVDMLKSLGLGIRTRQVEAVDVDEGWFADL